MSKSKPNHLTPPSLLRQTVRFLGTTAGLDLLLRLLHGLAIVVAHSADELLATRSRIASTQLNLARRHLRFFLFLGCLQSLSDVLAANHRSHAHRTLDIIHSSSLLLYFFLEDLTMLHDLQIYPVTWHLPVLVEANRFWFYAISASIVRSLLHLLTSRPRHVDKGRQTTNLRRLLVDALDLCLPASFVGWLKIRDLFIGYVMMASTLLVWKDVWRKTTT